MRITVLCVALAAMAAGCVFHHEIHSTPDTDRMEVSAAEPSAQRE